MPIQPSKAIALYDCMESAKKAIDGEAGLFNVQPGALRIQDNEIFTEKKESRAEMNWRAKIFKRRSNIIMNIADSENIENLSPCSKTLNEQVNSLKEKIAGLEADKKTLSLTVLAQKERWQIHAGDVCSLNNEVDHLRNEMVEFNDVYIEKIEIAKADIVAEASKMGITEIFTLDEIKEFCSENYGPGECFDEDALDEWATENDYI